jgi:hypothetical protein
MIDTIILNYYNIIPLLPTRLYVVVATVSEHHHAVHYVDLYLEFTDILEYYLKWDKEFSLKMKLG